MSVINTGKASKIGLKPQHTDKDTKDKGLMAAKRERMTLTLTIRATVRHLDSMECLVTFHISPDVMEDILFVSYEVIVQMGILNLPTQKRSTSVETENDKDKELDS